MYKKIRPLALLFALLAIIGTKETSAQHELGVRFGVANYIGDLAPRLVPSESKPALGLQYRLNMSANWKFRVNATYGRVSGADRFTDDFQPRNLSFRSNILEVGIEFEYDFLPFVPGSSQLSFTPYIFGGVAGFRFNPQAQLGNGGGWVNLQPLGTEGQNIPGSNLDPYSTISMSIPFGLGFKKSVSDMVVFSIEAGMRHTLTDYLDDVSGFYPDFNALSQTENGNIAVQLSDRRPEIGLEQAEVGSRRGNPNNRDWYGLLMISITKRLGYAPCYAF